MNFRHLRKINISFILIFKSVCRNKVKYKVNNLYYYQNKLGNYKKKMINHLKIDFLIQTNIYIAQ